MPDVHPSLQLSIVTTLYRTAIYLEDFVARSLGAAERAGFDPQRVELVLVNDGSPDNDLEVALHLHERDSRIAVVDLARNFGHHKAMMAGCMQARGEMVFLIDSDLEEDPEWLVTFAEVARRQQADLVFGVQQTRKGHLFERLTGDLFYKVFNRLSPHAVAENSVTARLMTRRFVDALVQHQEQVPFLFGLCALTGFKQQPVTVHKASTSPTTYTLGRKCRLAIHCITSFSSRPLGYIAALGALMTGVSFCYVLYLLFRQWVWNLAPEGWTSVTVSIWLVGGIIMLSLGIISLYLATLFNEVKRRPYVVIRSIHRHEATAMSDHA